jgi:hypothetical protein
LLTNLMFVLKFPLTERIPISSAGCLFCAKTDTGIKVVKVHSIAADVKRQFLRDMVYLYLRF